MSYVIAYLLMFAIGFVFMAYGNPSWGSYFVGIASGIALAWMLK